MRSLGVRNTFKYGVNVFFRFNLNVLRNGLGTNPKEAMKLQTPKCRYIHPVDMLICLFILFHRVSFIARVVIFVQLTLFVKQQLIKAKPQLTGEL